MMEINSYSKIYNLGHKEVKNIEDLPVEITEKIDGSQFSFGKRDGVLMCRSKGKQLILDAPEKLFSRAIEVVRSLEPALIDGYTYRGEYLAKPKHNALAYDRTPVNNIILFGIDIGDQDYLTYEKMSAHADALGLEVVPRLAERYDGIEHLKKMLETTSVLGGQKIEGVVLKAYGHYDITGKTLMAKFVSEEFKEVHRRDWKGGNAAKKDVVQEIVGSVSGKARWNKAIQHMREDGTLTEDPRDIGPIIKAVQRDISEECADEIRDMLFKEYWPRICRASVAGIPGWYKMKLAGDTDEDHKELD